MSSALLRYQALRSRSEALFDLLTSDAYYSQPISLRHPIVFYEGHLPAFSFNTLVRKALGGLSIDPHLERLFARGIDPEDTNGASDPETGWPSRTRVQEFAAEADSRVLDALARGDWVRQGHARLDC